MMNQNDNDKIKAKTIAVMPVENKSADNKAAQLLRFRLLEELYFKGYSKLSLEMIDKKMNINPNKKNASAIAPRKLKDAVGADAGL